MPSELPIRNPVKAQFNLQLHNLLDRLILHLAQLLLIRLAIVLVCADAKEVFWTEQRAQVLCSEGGVSMEGGRHYYGGRGGGLIGKLGSVGRGYGVGNCVVFGVGRSHW